MRARGFTLIELMIVVAVMGILATLAVAGMRAARPNATVSSAATALQMRIEQLQYVAMSEQIDQLLVVADVRNNDPRQCGSILDAGCARVFQLRGPSAAWKLQSFDVTAAGANVDHVVDEDRLGQGIKFHLASMSDGGTSPGTLPPPFDALGGTLKFFDKDYTADCGDNRTCVAYRFHANGRVDPEPLDPTSAPTTTVSGHAFALGSEVTGQYAGAQQLGVMVATPSGIVRTFPVP